MMENQQSLLCTHMKKMEKKAVSSLPQRTIQKSCSIHPQSSVILFCMHCGQATCTAQIQPQSKQCWQAHSIEHSESHIYYSSVNIFKIWCYHCKSQLNDQIFDYCGSNNNQDYLKIVRFIQYVKGYWEEVSFKASGVWSKEILRRGLINLGNTCFLNSVMQVLSITEELDRLYCDKFSFRKQGIEKKICYKQKLIKKEAQYFYSDVIEEGQSRIWNIVKSKKNKKNEQRQQNFKKLPIIKNLELNTEIQKALIQLNSEQLSRQPYSLWDVLDVLIKFNSKYSKKQQQDAEEVLLLIIQMLNEGERTGLDLDQQRYGAVQSLIGPQKINPIQQIFGFYLVNQIVCGQCKSTNHVFDLSYNLAIGVGKSKPKQQNKEPKKGKAQIKYYQQLYYPEQGQISPLFGCLFDLERINQLHNYYSCEKCKSTWAYRQYYVVNLPQILIISLKRFNHNMNKKTDYIEFPQQLSLKYACLDPNENSSYQIYGIIVHEGKSISSGHYICFVKDRENNWFKCSDKSVGKVSWRQVKIQQAYILFYRQRMIVC